MLELIIEETYDSYDDFLAHINCSNRELLFHGGLESVSDPKADYAGGNPKADFGLGFYTTTLPTQAEDWAHQSSSGDGVVSVYAFTDCLESHFSVGNIRPSGLSSSRNVAITAEPMIWAN